MGSRLVTLGSVAIGLLLGVAVRGPHRPDLLLLEGGAEHRAREGNQA